MLEVIGELPFAVRVPDERAFSGGGRTRPMSAWDRVGSWPGVDARQPCCHAAPVRL